MKSHKNKGTFESEMRPISLTGVLVEGLCVETMGWGRNVLMDASDNVNQVSRSSYQKHRSPVSFKCVVSPDMMHWGDTDKLKYWS